MEHIREPGICGGEEDVWRFYTIEEAEQHQNQCSNWPSTLEDFKKYLGKTWLDKKDIRYLVNGKPVYREYTLIGVEDNEAWMDYYWILEDPLTKRRKWELVNNASFYKNFK